MKKRHKKKTGATPKSPGTVLTSSDKVKLMGVPLCAISFAIWIVISAHTTKQENAIDRLIVRWRVNYQLNDDQAEQLRQIELSFHGNGNPFAYRRPRSREEIYEHHVIMSKVVDKEFSARFFSDLEGGNRLRLGTKSHFE